MREPKREKEEEDLKRVSHYRVIRTLGQGGMGKVYEAFDETLERKVALKAIRADHRLRQHAKIRFLREARTLSQLDHPNICRIHDYVVGDGKDYLVLELVEGRTLRHALEDGLNKTEKLAIAEQIAEALDVAHAAGIVHRDLKPDNVMLTADRVVKILDFGLARMEPGETSRSTNEEEAPTSEEGALSGGALSESEEETYPAGTLSAMSLDITAEPAGPVVQTRRGALVGTVMWMSPEQAAGNPATTASDMYAYGLLLQWMLTGRSPYSRTESADALLAKVFQGDTLPVDGVSPDLAMLIRRLESMAPAHRPTAFEALERLRFLRDKPKRRLRMAIVILAVAVVTLGALKYTLDLGRERSLAIEAREEAERRREQAERLIDFMLGDLRTKLTPIGNLDILDDIGDEALEYFGGIPADELDDAELFRRSGALRLLGEVRVARGDLPAALTAFEESLALAKGLFARDPQNVDWVQGLGTAHYWIGYVLDDQGDSDGALEHFEAYQRAAEQLARIDPDRPEWQLEVGYSHFNIGVVLDARGELEQALVEYQKTLAIEEDISRRLPDDSDVKFELATTYRIVGRTVEKLGRLQEARSYYESDLQITEELVVEQPTHAVWVSYLAIGHGYLAALLRSMGRLDEAMPHYAANQRIREELMDMDPSNQIWQRESAVAYLALGRAELEAGNLGRARALFLQSVSILEGLTALDATNRDWREQLASSRVALGELLYKEERFGDARAAASQALALAEDLALEETTELVQRFCAESHLLMGKAEHAVGLYEEAEASWTQGVEVIEPAVRATSDTRLMAVLAKLQLYLDDARAESLMRALLERGYRRKDLVELCVQRGVCDAGTLSVRGTDSPR